MQKAEHFADANKSTFLDYLYQQNIVNQDTVGQALAEHFEVTYADFYNIPTKEMVLKIPEGIAIKFKAVLYSENNDEVTIASVDPHNSELMGELKKIFPGKNIRLAYANLAHIKEAFNFYRKELQTKFSEILKSDKPVAPELLDAIFEDSIHHNASDIHMEPQVDEALIRFRIDGVLIEAGKISKEHYNNILNLIKVMANAKIDDHFSAQDGSIRHKSYDTTIDMRISIIPTVNGEKVTIRILAHYVKGFAMEDIGLTTAMTDEVMQAAKKPFGMILVVGPTGSGKTTTLYSLIKILNRPEINITTIEDPVEYRISGINQIQVNDKTNLSFAQGLRSIVRQDPDVILVGEIRDNETADISVNAALTGHLLLSTFHANNAAAAFPRLLDMGVESYLLASTLELIIAQRLVRKICSNCMHSVTKHVSDLSDRLPNPQQYFPNEEITLYEGKGCEACNHTGFHGRTGIYETINITKEMRALLAGKPTADQIAQLSKDQGGHFMFDDGINKVLTGITTLDELIRVINPQDNAEVEIHR